ncbi:hypothetical protein GCM10010272_70720 [Streptomyces lateritius]|nr:hypothetical protein GCM10010272_70720 [Streptomyces lateritius]
MLTVASMMRSAGDGFSYDEGGSARGVVQDTADGVVERGGGIERAGCGVGEPLPQAVDDGGDSGDGIPFASRVEIEAQSITLQDVGSAGEPDVGGAHLGRNHRGDGQSEEEVLTLLELQSS